MSNNNFTTKFNNIEKEKDINIKDTLELVFNSLEEKGYNPIDQMVGYLVSGDPTYVTSHNNARSNIKKLERDEIVEELLKNYLGK
ncbi:MAG: IreB family regulatory phosphoprotein [Firmicutes bacterium]|jgi:uncharacterized protein (UPF0297 family)|nr:IreB family regulatory phosphoprotein [Bacillota bacterium]